MDKPESAKHVSTKCESLGARRRTFGDSRATGVNPFELGSILFEYFLTNGIGVAYIGEQRVSTLNQSVDVHLLSNHNPDQSNLI